MEIAPDVIDCWLFRSLLYYSIGEYERCISDISSYILAIENDSIYMETSLFIRSQAYIRIHSYQDAIADFSRILTISPDNTYALYMRGCLYNTDADPQAIKDFERALALGNAVPEVYLELGNAYLLKAEYGNALEYFKEAFSIDNRCCRAYANAGYCYFVLGLYPIALQQFLLL